jgi:hypothetical protein
MDLREQVARILQSGPGCPVCDACLAFALEAPLLAIQAISKNLVGLPGEYTRMVGACSNCDRSAATTVFLPVGPEQSAPMGGLHEAQRKCVRCSRRVTKEEEHVDHGDLFHRQCWAVLASEAQIADSRQMARLSQLLIAAAVRDSIRRRPQSNPAEMLPRS